MRVVHCALSRAQCGTNFLLLDSPAGGRMMDRGADGPSEKVSTMDGRDPSREDERADEVVSRAQLRRKNQITLPPQVRDALQLSEGDEVEFTVHPDGEVTLRGMMVIP